MATQLRQYCKICKCLLFGPLTFYRKSVTVHLSKQNYEHSHFFIQKSNRNGVLQCRNEELGNTSLLGCKDLLQISNAIKPFLTIISCI